MSQIPTSVDAAARQVARRLDAALPRQAMLLASGDADHITAQLTVAPHLVVARTSPHARPAPSPSTAAEDVEILAHPGALPFADGSFDGAYAAGAWLGPWVQDPSRALAELHRVVTPGQPIVLVGDAGSDDTTTWAERGFAVDVLSTPPDVFVASSTSRGPDEVRIRGLRRDEAERVGRLTLDAYDRFGTIDGPYRDFLADPLQRLDTTSALLVAEYAGEVVGTVTYVEPGDAAWEGPDPPHGDCGFRVLAVAPEVQGRGVGPRLVTACRQRAAEAGRHRMFISSMTWMTRAHRMYERAGFVRRPDLDVMFPAGPGVIFTLDLTAEAPDRFPPPGPVPTELPWYTDVWTH